MKTGWRLRFFVGFLASSWAALGGPVFTQLHSFGFAESSAANPSAELILGSDGALYGTTSAGGQAGRGTVFRLNLDGSGFQLVKEFGTGTNDGWRPMSAVIQGSDGALYGTTDEGGQFGFGTVFELSTDGNNFKVLKDFFGGSDGGHPEARLMEASDGLLYGTASGGGTNDSGLVFRLAKDGSGFTTLIQFNGTNGASPESGLIEASDGLLYGTTCSSSTSTNAGSVYRLQKDGTGFEVLKLFLSSSTTKTNGAAPQAGLIEGTNGVLFGTTSAGGTNGTGTIFRVNKDGSGFGTIYNFATNNTPDGRISLGDLILASDGLLYGTTYDGGTNGNGTVFRLGQDATAYEVMARLVSPQGPAAGVLEATNGLLYGTSQLGGDAGEGTIFALQKDGSGASVLKSFAASGGDGRSPYSSPVSATNDLLYGTTRTGGSNAVGTIYSLRFDGIGYGSLSSLAGGAGGANPVGTLLQSTNALLYGISQFGGSSNKGTLFDLDLLGANFGIVLAPGDSLGGQEYRAGLIQASDGFLYGTSVSGGTGSEGTLFRLAADGSGYTVLKNFASGPTGPGSNPLVPLLEATDHNLYGTTGFGGTTNRGVLFRMTKDGGSYVVLKSFGAPATDGETPMSPLMEASDGLLFGSTYGGGSTNNGGTVFRINKDGTGFQVLVSFSASGGDGRHPCGGLVEWEDGSLYGTTERGGIDDQGTLFRVNKAGGGYSIVASFGGSFGAFPRGGLTRGPDGSLYGATEQGGKMGFGTVFRYGAAFGDIIDLRVANQSPTVKAVGQPGTNYVLEYSVALGPTVTWAPVYDTNAPANGQLSFVDPVAAADAKQRFYRLKR